MSDERPLITDYPRRETPPTWPQHLEVYDLGEYCPHIYGASAVAVYDRARNKHVVMGVRDTTKGQSVRAALRNLGVAEDELRLAMPRGKLAGWDTKITPSPS